MVTHRGCHCGRVRFEVVAPTSVRSPVQLLDVRRTGYLHLIVPKERFNLVSGAEVLTTGFNTAPRGTSSARCAAVKSFYVPLAPRRLQRERCLDEGTLGDMTIVRKDGKN
jgi:hypothetical protein